MKPELANAAFETALKTCNIQYFCDGTMCVAAVGAKTVRKLIAYKQVTGGSNESNNDTYNKYE